MSFANGIVKLSVRVASSVVTTLVGSADLLAVLDEVKASAVCVCVCVVTESPGVTERLRELLRGATVCIVALPDPRCVVVSVAINSMAMMIAYFTLVAN